MAAFVAAIAASEVDMATSDVVMVAWVILKMASYRVVLKFGPVEAKIDALKLAVLVIESVIQISLDYLKLNHR